MEEIEHAQNTERGGWRYRSWADTQRTFQWSGDDLRCLSRGRGGGEREGWGEEGGGGGRGALRRGLGTAGFVSPLAQLACTHLS